MAFSASSYILTGAAVDTRTRDQLSFNLLAHPQAMSLYVRFVEMGTITIASAYVLYIGNASVFLEIDSTGTFYRAQYNNGISAAVNSTLAAAPTVGQRVELLLTLTAGGIITLSQSINEGAISTAASGAARVLPSVWGATTLWVNSFSTAGVGFNAFRNIEIMGGVQTMQVMRVRAGV